MMSRNLTREEHRIAAVRVAYESMATEIVSGQRPDEDDARLLIDAVGDAALVGDRPLLRVISEVTRRLGRHIPRYADWRPEWTGKLWAIGVLAVRVAEALEHEDDWDG